MKNNIILYMCVFLLLNSCGANHDVSTAIKKHIDETKNTHIDEIKKYIDEIKNTHIDEIKSTNIDEIDNLIEKGKTILDKKKMIPNEPAESQNSKTDKEVFTIGLRAFNFINTFLTENEIDEFETIFHKPSIKSTSGVLNSITILELSLENAINYLSLKKDVLDQVKIADLKKIKNSLEELFSIRKLFSTVIKQILLDYQNNKSLIKTDDSKLETYINVILSQFNNKNKEVNDLKTTILSIPIPNIVD
ncbi:CRASP family complement regulator-acquiring lipoprotein [Borreliella lusitaniae]|uniref:CRASP family complement regulator-acquiring lipoprotein n=1 Tax=Borreliella lusitaniae TaxID=100177 RepID=UPI003C736E34